jgi:hypothetical protein
MLEILAAFQFRKNSKAFSTENTEGTDTVEAGSEIFTSH